MNVLISDKLEERLTEAGRKGWRCRTCGFERSGRWDVARHIEQKHLELSMSCNFCDAVFSRRDKLKSNMKNKHEVYWAVFLLDVDNEIYSRMMSGRNDLNELIWSCTECSYNSKKKSNTFRHIEANHMSCSYSCPVCGHDARSRFNLKQHMSMKHRTAGVVQMSSWSSKMGYCRCGVGYCSQRKNDPKHRREWIKDVDLLLLWLCIKENNQYVQTYREKTSFSCIEMWLLPKGVLKQKWF